MLSTTHKNEFSGRFVVDRSALRQNLSRDCGNAISEEMYRACMKYYFGE
jgi:hypothetical protein